MKTNFFLLISFILLSGINMSISALVLSTPTVQATNVVISNKTATSATISWTNGDGAKRVVFVEYPSGIAAAPYDNTTYTASTDWNSKGTKIGTSNYYCIYNGTGSTVTITNLSPNSTYAVRVSEYNGAAGSELYFTPTATNNPITFTTLAAGVTTPTVQATNVVISNKTATSATISWTNGDGAKRVVFVEYPSGIAAAPYDNTTYTASTDWNSKGTKIGTSNYYCIYNGTGSTVTISNLSPNSTYAVRVSEYNGAAGSELYFTPTATNNPITFTTLAAGVGFEQATDVAEAVSVSPNPTSGVIKVKLLREISKPMIISISDVNGKVVYNSTTRDNNVEIDLTNEALGMYLVKIEISGNSSVYKVFKK